MRRFRPGDRVVLRSPVRRGRRHKYGRARVRKGAHGRVTERHTKLMKASKYDVDFGQGRFRQGQAGQGRSRTVRKVPAASLRRPRSPLALVLGVLVVLLVIGYLSH
jgi:hypothetical protein